MYMGELKFFILFSQLGVRIAVKTFFLKRLEYFQWLTLSGTQAVVTLPESIPIQGTMQWKSKAPCELAHPVIVSFKK